MVDNCDSFVTAQNILNIQMAKFRYKEKENLCDSQKITGLESSKISNCFNC